MDEIICRMTGKPCQFDCEEVCIVEKDVDRIANEVAQEISNKAVQASNLYPTSTGARLQLGDVVIKQVRRKLTSKT